MNNISIYWWNLGTKTLDFKGDINEFVKQKNFKISKIKHKKFPEIKGYKIKFNMSSSNYTIETYNDLEDSLSIAIRSYLEHLGDKSIFRDTKGREYKINWY